MSDDDDLADFSKFQRDADDIRPIDIGDLGTLTTIATSHPGPADAAASDDVTALTDLPPAPDFVPGKTKRLRDGTVVPDNIAEYVYDEDKNKMFKGDYFDLIKKVPALKKIFVAVGWDQISVEDDRLDVDLSLFLLNRDGQTREDSDFLFYNNDMAGDGMVRHLGDNRTGAGEGDNETVSIDLESLHFDVAKIVVVLTVYDPDFNGLHLGQARNIFVRLINEDDGNEITRYVADEAVTDHYNALIALTLVREGPRWYAEVTAEPSKGALQALAQSYGIIVAEATG